MLVAASITETVSEPKLETYTVVLSGLIAIPAGVFPTGIVATIVLAGTPAPATQVVVNRKPATNNSEIKRRLVSGEVRALLCVFIDSKGSKRARSLQRRSPQRYLPKIEVRYEFKRVTLRKPHRWKEIKTEVRIVF